MADYTDPQTQLDLIKRAALDGRDLRQQILDDTIGAGSAIIQQMAALAAQGALRANFPVTPTSGGTP